VGFLDALYGAPGQDALDPAEATRLRQRSLLLGALAIHPFFGGGVERIFPSLYDTSQLYERSVGEALEEQRRRAQQQASEGYQQSLSAKYRSEAQAREQKTKAEAEYRRHLLAQLPDEERRKYGLASIAVLEKRVYQEPKKEKEPNLQQVQLGDRVVLIDPTTGEEVREMRRGATPGSRAPEKPPKPRGFTPGQWLGILEADEPPPIDQEMLSAARQANVPGVTAGPQTPPRSKGQLAQEALSRSNAGITPTAREAPGQEVFEVTTREGVQQMSREDLVALAREALAADRGGARTRAALAAMGVPAPEIEAILAEAGR
jgi:hypothetical protein